MLIFKDLKLTVFHQICTKIRIKSSFVNCKMHSSCSIILGKYYLIQTRRIIQILILIKNTETLTWQFTSFFSDSEKIYSNPFSSCSNHHWQSRFVNISRSLSKLQQEQNFAGSHQETCLSVGNCEHSDSSTVVSLLGHMIMFHSQQWGQMKLINMKKLNIIMGAGLDFLPLTEKYLCW